MRLKLANTFRPGDSIQTVRMNFLIGVSGKPENIDRKMTDQIVLLEETVIGRSGVRQQGVRVLTGRVCRVRGEPAPSG